MKRGKRPGTRGGRRADSLVTTDPFEQVTLPRPRAKVRLPSDIADAAEAALDDMLRVPERAEADDEELRTQTRASSHQPVVEPGEDDEQMTATAPANRPSKMPLPAPPRTTSVHVVPSTPVPRGSSAPVRPTPPSPPRPSPAPAARPSPVPVRPTPTPSLARAEPAPVIHTPTPVLPRPRTAGALGDAQQGGLDATTSDPGGVTDATARVPEVLALDLESGPVTTDPDELVPVRDITPLQVAIYEESAHLPSAQGAVVAAGHVVRVGASSKSDLARLLHELRGGEIDVVIAALPGGEPVIQAALALEPRRPIVIASVAGSSVSAVARAHAAGADLAVPRPHDVERLAPVLFAASRLHLEKRVALAARGAEQVLRARLDELSDPEPRGLLPFELFQRVLELEIKRAKRFEYPLSVALFAVDIPPPPPPAGIRGILRARAGNALIHTVRDIDIATQLDHERFLVLLPYTDLKGAAGLGRRIISGVAAGDPVIAAGRTFPPRVVGAVAGAMPGQALSFAKLMKDATRALEQARRDGAELAVQP